MIYDDAKSSEQPTGQLESNWSRAIQSQKIVIEDPRTSTPGLGLLLWVKSVYGDKAGDAWGKLRRSRIDRDAGLVGSLWPVHQG